MQPDRPVDNAPYYSLTHAGLTVEGWSRAAVQSYWRVPELKIGFDLGAQPWGFMGTATWLLSHTHLDHIAALPVYVARRRMMKMEPPTIYMPESAIEPIEPSGIWKSVIGAHVAPPSVGVRGDDPHLLARTDSLEHRVARLELDRGDARIVAQPRVMWPSSFGVRGM